MKNFFGEFKKFITRGNVVDMAVGVIVGSSFTAIVNAMSNNILKPITNWLLTMLFGDVFTNGEVYTMLKPGYTQTEVDGVLTDTLDLSKSIYIDWGAFINAVINFFLIALVLFTIVKVINRMRERHQAFADNFIQDIKKNKLTKEQKKELKENGINRKDKEAVDAYFAEKAAREEAEKKAAEEAAAEQARLDREANPTAEDLLKEIRDLLRKNA